MYGNINTSYLNSPIIPQMSTHYFLYALIIITAIPIFTDIARPWLVPYLVLYSFTALAVAVGAEKKVDIKKKTDEPLVGGTNAVGSIFTDVRVVI